VLCLCLIYSVVAYFSLVSLYCGWKFLLCIRVELSVMLFFYFFFFQAEDGIRDLIVTGVQTCALPI